MSSIPRTTALILALALPALAIEPDCPQAPPATVDPFTLGDAAAMHRAGYVSFGPFAFGTNHDSTDVQNLLPDERICWIETAHFRIGASLSAWKVAGDKATLAKLRQELQQLGERLPGVRADARELEPWLRAHLVAQRCERVYAEVCAVLGVRDADFPPAPGHDPKQGAKFMGLGPYLGMAEKYTVLLVRESPSLGRYTAAHHGWATIEPARFFDHRFGTAFFGAAEASSFGLLRDDVALHTHLGFHIAWLLYTSYRAYGHDLPVWIPVGLAQRHARRVSTSIPVYDLEPGAPGRKRYEQWGKRWPGLLRARAFEPLPVFLERMDVDSFSMDQHLEAWALVEYLLDEQHDAFVRFLDAMKDPFCERLRFPTREELFARQQAALRAAFGTDAAGLEERWRRLPVSKTARR